MPEDPRIGTTIGSFRIESLIGRGGMGVVYLAEQDYPRRRVALKVLAPEIAADEGFRQRFVRESNTAAAIEHPNIIPIYAAGESDGLLFIAMRYIDGIDLGSLIAREGRLDPARALRITGQIGRALDAAHEEGLIHRDVKPGNILVARPRGSGGTEHTYLADFGLTKRTTSQTGLTATGMFMGTVDYVAPEQIRGEAVGGPADQYALACVLYHCLTGETPFRKDADIAVITAHLMDPPPRASAVRPELPGGLDDVLAKAMAKDPNERYPSCAEFAEAARRGCGVAPLGPAPTVVAGPPAAASPTVVPPAGTEVAPETAVPSTPKTAPPSPAPTAAPPAGPTVAPPRPPRAPRARRRRTAALALGALALGGVGAALWLVLGDGEAPGDGTALRIAGRPANVTDDPAVDFAPTWSPDGAQIAFVSDRSGGDLDIFSMNADGTEATLLTDDPGEDIVPDWSPDGTKIAFASNRNGEDDVFVMNADGSGVVQLTNNPEDDGVPAWSPDGEKIAFASNRDGNFDVFVMNADGSEVTRLTEDPADDTVPAWSPDGTKIAFASDEDGEFDVFVMNADGSDPTRITDTPTVETGPAWFPDGTKIAFTRDVEEPDIFVVDADGSGYAPLLDDPNEGEASPDWTSDGTRLTFFADEGENLDVFVAEVRVDSTEPSDGIVGESLEAKKPLFSPDGLHIAFEGLDGSILVMEIDGGAVNVLDSAGADVAWFPDGGRVAYSAAGGGIVAINVDGTERTTVTDFGAHPTWSPGGTEIAFEDVTGIYVVDAAGGEPDRIREFGVQPVWAPDGRFIAFAEREGGTCVVKPNSRGGKCFTPSGVNPSWHPASETYAFEALEGGISLVKLSDELVPLTEFGKNPVFNPDGDLIAFEEPGGGIFTVDLNGETRQLSDDGSNPSWTTDGEEVVFDDGTGMIFTVKADGTETPTELLVSLQT